MRMREWVETFGRDVTFALRQLRRSLPFTVGVVLVLGFGIGASATVFSWMEALVLRPLPAVREVERLVTIRQTDRSAFTSSSSSVRTGEVLVSLPDYVDWREEARSVPELAAVSLFMFGVQADGGAGDGRAEPLYGMFASDNYFHVVGVRPALGRAFLPADDVPAAAPVAIISDRLWQTRFGGAADVVGRRLRINGEPATIVGVAPAGFGGTLAGVNFDLWVPLRARPLYAPGRGWDTRAYRWLDVIGRLAPGADLEQADAELREIGARLAAAHPENRDRGVRVGPLDTGPAEQLRPLFWTLIALTVLVVLIVCSNVANLLLVRAAARAREIGVRLSLGATQGRLVRQLMTENVVLAVMGAAVGLVATWYGRGLLERFLPTTSIPLVVDPQLDLQVLGYVMGVTCLSVIVFGLAPALLSARVDLAGVLKSGGRGSAGSRGRRLRSALVVAQFALSLTSLICGALFLRRSEQLRQMERGFSDPAHVLLVETDMSFAGYRDTEQWQRTVEQIVDRLRALPGARAASAATFVPLGLIGPWHAEFGVEGYAPRSNESMRFMMSGVAPDYFDLMGVAIMQGRAIEADDTRDRPAVAVVNESFARRFWPDQSPIGRLITMSGRPLTVVGVARDGKYDYKRIDDPTPPFVYYAMRQRTPSWVTFHLRTAVDPLTMVSAVRQSIASVDARIPINAPLTLAQFTATPMIPSQLAVVVLGVLSAAGLALAAMGLYAIIAYTVTLRTREIGIRLALGGTGRQVIAIFVGETVRLLAVSVAVGAAVAAAATVILHRQLVVLPLPDVAAVAVPVGILSAVALVAGLVPARRSATIDVASTLREE